MVFSHDFVLSRDKFGIKALGSAVSRVKKQGVSKSFADQYVDVHVYLREAT